MKPLATFITVWALFLLLSGCSSSSVRHGDEEEPEQVEEQETGEEFVQELEANEEPEAELEGSDLDLVETPAEETEFEDEIIADTDESGEVGEPLPIQTCAQTCRDQWEWVEEYQDCRSTWPWRGQENIYCNQDCTTLSLPVPFVCQGNHGICVPTDVGNKGYLFETFDGGCGWTTTAMWTGTDYCDDLVLVQFDDPWIVCINTLRSDIYRQAPDSNDGISEQVRLTAVPGYYLRIFVLGTAPRVFYLRTYEDYFFSTDEGVTWDTMSILRNHAGSGEDILELKSVGANGLNIFASINKWGIQHSPDGGKTWNPGLDESDYLRGYSAVANCTKVVAYSWDIRENGDPQVLASIMCKEKNPIGEPFIRFFGLIASDLNLEQWRPYTPPASIGMGSTIDEVRWLTSIHLDPENRWIGYGYNDEQNSSRQTLLIEDQARDRELRYLVHELQSYDLQRVWYETNVVYLFGLRTQERIIVEPEEHSHIEHGLPWYEGEYYKLTVQNSWVDPDNPAHIKLFAVYRVPRNAPVKAAP